MLESNLHVRLFPFARTPGEKIGMSKGTHPITEAPCLYCANAESNDDCGYWLCQRCCSKLDTPCTLPSHRKARISRGGQEHPPSTTHRMTSVAYRAPAAAAIEGAPDAPVEVDVVCEHRWAVCAIPRNSLKHADL